MVAGCNPPKGSGTIANHLAGSSHLGLSQTILEMTEVVVRMDNYDRAGRLVWRRGRPDSSDESGALLADGSSISSDECSCGAGQTRTPAPAFNERARRGGGRPSSTSRR